MSFEDKVKIAQELRRVYKSRLIAPDGMRVPEDRVVTEHQVIPTSKTSTCVFLHKPMIEPVPDSPWIVNLHDGAFVLGYQENDRIFARKLAADSGCLVLDIDYGLAPESPYPFALNECYDVIKWMQKHTHSLNIDKDRLVLLGHGAGGNLAALISLLAANRHEFEIKLQILIEPSLDLYTNSDPFENNRDAYIEARMQMYDLYLDDREKRKDPLVSPVFTPPDRMRGVAPSLIITDEGDYWGNEQERYIMNLVDAGNLVIVKHMGNSHHGFLVDFVDEYRETFRFIIDALEVID